VVLVTLDTLRADHLSCYGYRKQTSPRLDAFASRATRYTSSFATAPWTTPTHASLFTGLHPFEHGAVSFETTRPSRNAHPLDAAHETLAERLHGEGYATAGIVANTIYLDAGFGLEQGFELWDPRREWGEAVTERALAWIDARGEPPFFLFVNYLDTHRPYNVTARPGERVYANAEHPAILLGKLRERVMVRGEPPGELGALVIEQYDRAIRNVDAALGALLDGLAERGLYDASLIIVTSDHGEYFGEHGLVEHSKDVYRPALAVPLVVKRPGQTRGEVVETPVSSVDVPALVLEALPEAIRRRHAGAFPYRPGSHPILAENHFSRPNDLVHPVFGARFRRVRRALQADGFTYIDSSDGRHELYRLDTDPGESQDLVAQLPDVAARLAGRLAELQSRGRARLLPPTPERVDPELLEQMRALGYVADETDTP
jgi:arylsulfatase A-like enzyme